MRRLLNIPIFRRTDIYEEAGGPQPTPRYIPQHLPANRAGRRRNIHFPGHRLSQGVKSPRRAGREIGRGNFLDTVQQDVGNLDRFVQGGVSLRTQLRRGRAEPVHLDLQVVENRPRLEEG